MRLERRLLADGNVDRRCCLAPGPELGLSGSQFRIGLGESNAQLGVIDNNQRITRLHSFVLVHSNARDVAGHLVHDGDDACVDLSVFGGFAVLAGLPLAVPPPRSDGENDNGRCNEQVATYHDQ